MTQLNYQLKFKDRDPLETIKIIEDYFNSLDLNIIVDILEQTSSLTWYCRLYLKHNNTIVIGQNGKGTTKEYCLASGYGELYERFCSQHMFYMDPFVCQKIMQENFEEKGYYFIPEEKEISFEQAFLTTQSGRDLVKAYSSNKTQDIKDFFNLLANNKYIGVPFIKAENPADILYLDPRFTYYLHSSSGLACGNNFYEAFVQGMSEMYEHSVIRRYWLEPQERYYVLDLTQIENNHLKHIINKIEERNKLYIIDFSYNFNVPVLMSLIVNKQTHAISVNLGSSPIFEIALERVLTELYQGFNNFEHFKTSGQVPAIDSCNYETRHSIWSNSEVISPMFPEFVFENFVYNNKFNDNIFLSGNYSNEELFQYLLTINQINNLDIYYKDNSGCKNMYAIELIDINAPQPLVNLETVLKYSTEDKVLESVQLCKDFYNLVNNYLSDNTFDLNLYYRLMNQSMNFTHEQRCHVNFLLQSNYLCRSNPTGLSITEIFELISTILNHQDEIFNGNNEIVRNVNKNPYMYDTLIAYITIFRYAAHPKYPLEEILTILDFLQISYNYNDIINLEDKNYWITKILLSDIIYTNSKEFTPYYEAIKKYTFYHEES